MAATKRLVWLFWALSAVVGAAAQTVDEGDFSQTEIDSGNALSQLNELAASASEETSGNLAKRGGSCGLGDIHVRREWRTLSKAQRTSYINAVKCMKAAPSLFPPGQIGGAKSLFDDFIAIHIFQTGTIHNTGNFLTWHRYFIYTYEQKLRDVCGYQGPFPYWEWGLDVKNPAKSPVFDGSATSLGGNGAYEHHDEGLWFKQQISGNLLKMQPGSGGGCVTTGPFQNLSITFGRIVMLAYGSENFISDPDPINDNTRCLKRDLNAWVASRYTSFRNSTSLILQNNDIEHFQALMQGDDRYVVGELGVHGGGHFTIGGDPGSDPFISPGDPAFYLHHAQIDRIYWIWQSLDFKNRQGVFGTNTLQNNPPSEDTTVEDFIDISPLAEPVKIKDLMNTVGGTPLCYIYL
ncbi:related to monophenol monooxygenase (tyrosinase) [Cephalotrichum gorgonifer]|uniref:Related to monophenol monooxygenase (Tyrosinase) n=1 Tax=Cephalotrichum gorgonifer TaxID=2041049 RepID=A0AAE8N5H9_9PEZI|nr:related to monophenol monooxygenase (tyrosinase) [Cephalotrichum gorgonifer]